MPAVKRSITIQAPPAAVWRWLASQEGLRRWIAADIEIELRVGGAYRFTGPDGATRISGEVLEFAKERALVLSWLEERAGWLTPAQLSITLEPAPDGATVSLVHDRFEAIGSPRWAEVAKAYDLGAKKHRLLEKLAELAAEGLVA